MSQRRVHLTFCLETIEVLLVMCIWANDSQSFLNQSTCKILRLVSSCPCTTLLSTFQWVHLFFYRVSKKLNLLQVIARDFSLWFSEIVVLRWGDVEFFGWDLIKNWYFWWLIKTERYFLFPLRRVMSGWQVLIGLFFDIIDVLSLFEIKFWCWKPNTLVWNYWSSNLVTLDSVLFCLPSYHFYILSCSHRMLRLACWPHLSCTSIGCYI
jgi:hypothetical protein